MREWLELLTKIVSALALTVLGVVGACFQARSAAVEQNRAKERRYLPMLHTLVELDQELAHFQQWAAAGGHDDREFPKLLSRRGDDLMNVAYEVYTPDGDPKIITPAVFEHDRPESGSERVKLPLRAAALLCAELLRLDETLVSVPDGTKVWLDPAYPNMLALEGEARTLGRIPIEPDSVAAWAVLLGNDRKVLASDMYGYHTVLVRYLRFGIAKVTHDTLTGHPELGEAYTHIREQFPRRRLTTTAGGKTAG